MHSLLAEIALIAYGTTLIYDFQMQSEQGFWIQDAEHDVHTNRYTFEFPSQWIQASFNTKPSIGIRSIRLVPSSRTISMSNLSIKSKLTGEYMNVSFDINLSEGDTMSDMNRMLSTIRHDTWSYGSLGGNDAFSPYAYTIEYDFTSSSLVFKINNKDDWFIIDETDTPCVSDDFKSIVGITDNSFWIDLAKLSNGTIQKTEFDKQHTEPCTIQMRATGGIAEMRFPNVWNRMQLRINASFANLVANQYVGYTNATFMPPKYYDALSDSHQFWIELYDSHGHPIELASDRRDTLVMESVLLRE